MADERAVMVLELDPDDNGLLSGYRLNFSSDQEAFEHLRKTGWDEAQDGFLVDGEAKIMKFSPDEGRMVVARIMPLAEYTQRLSRNWFGLEMEVLQQALQMFADRK